MLIKPRAINPNYGGGVAILINKKLQYTEINEFQNIDAEFLAIKTKIKNNEVLEGTLYKPPNASLKIELFKEISFKFKHFIIGIKNNLNW